ncbi:MAG: GntR family transcriptional regulator, partial [Pseudomonadota bacterium]
MLPGAARIDLHRLDADASEPVLKRCGDELRAVIRADKLRLANEYGLSVGTVRKGVDGLVQEGLLERRQGSGTFVRAPSFDATLFRFFQFREADGSQLS